MVRATLAGQHICAVVAGQGVTECRACSVLDADQRIGAAVPIRRSSGKQIDGHGVRIGGVVGCVTAVSRDRCLHRKHPRHQPRAAAVQRVVPRTAAQHVVTGQPLENIVARVAVNYVTRDSADRILDVQQRVGGRVGLRRKRKSWWERLREGLRAGAGAKIDEAYSA